MGFYTPSGHSHGYGNLYHSAQHPQPGGPSGSQFLAKHNRHGGHVHRVCQVVEYTYQVNGLNYQGKYIRVGDQFVTFRTAVDPYLIPVRYPMGASVTVYYNPANPVEAGLER
jgi:hypothetical protein